MLQLSVLTFKKGSYVLVEGKKEDRFYIIQKGNIRISHEIEIPGTVPEVLGPGDFAGVISCMSGQANQESAIAMTDVMVIAVKREQYPELFQNNTPVALKVIRTFAKKMRETNEAIMLQTASSVATDNPEQIFDVAEYYDNDDQTDIAVFSYYQYLKAVQSGPRADKSKIRFAKLKKGSGAVYLEPTADPVRQYPKNTMIFSEAQSGAEMFIIQQGSVKISKVVMDDGDEEGREVTFAILKKGDMFGEMALLENKPRSASAIANDDCVLMTVNKQNFNQMVTSQPQMIARLTTTFAQRLWPMSRQLINAMLPDPVAKMLDMLCLQLEKNKVGPDTGNNYQTSYTPSDIATMCGLSKEDQAKTMYKFQTNSLIKVEKNKIKIPDVDQLYKQSIFYRKTLARKLASN